MNSYQYIGRTFRMLQQQRGNGDLIKYTYDQGRRLTEKKTTNTKLITPENTEGLINHYAFGYNKIHMKTYEKRNHDGGKGDVYAYDSIQRMTKVGFNTPDPVAASSDFESASFEKSWSATYDKLDNIMSIVKTTGEQSETINGIIPDASTNSKLNQYSEFNHKGLDYDQKGNTKQKGGLKFYYDYRNQLVRVIEGGITTAHYKYDALGRRIEKSVGTHNFKYYYSGHHVIEERDGSDSILAQYMYGNGIDQIFRMDKYENGTPVPYYFNTDTNGSVMAITDADGNMVERMAYDAFGVASFTEYVTDPGNPTIASQSIIGNTILYQGRRYDSESNLYYYRARYYDPTMGRFLQTDPMGYHDSMNLYQAFYMNGINFMDPMGRDAWRREVYLWMQDRISTSVSYYSSSDSVIVYTAGNTLSELGSGLSSVFNLGTRSGEAIVLYGDKEDWESKAMLSSTIFGEIGEAILTGIGIYGTATKALQQIKNLKRLNQINKELQTVVGAEERGTLIFEKEALEEGWRFTPEVKIKGKSGRGRGNQGIDQPMEKPKVISENRQAVVELKSKNFPELKIDTKDIVQGSKEFNKTRLDRAMQPSLSSEATIKEAARLRETLNKGKLESYKAVYDLNKNKIDSIYKLITDPKNSKEVLKEVKKWLW